MKITENQFKKEKIETRWEDKGRPRSTQVDQLVALFSSIVMSYFLVGLEPCYPVCHLLQFLFFSSCPPPSRRSLGRAFCHFSCRPLHLHSFGHHPRWMCGTTNSSDPQPRATSPWTVRLLPGYSGRHPRLFYCSGQQGGLTYKHQGCNFR